MLEFLSDYTIRNVALGAALLGVISGVLGVFAVLRKQSLLGDTLSHAALPGVCLGFIVAGTRDLGYIIDRRADFRRARRACSCCC
jgi:manganese/zinc/iron transport system permease protein